MNTDASQKLKELIIYTALSQWRLRRTQPDRTGPATLGTRELKRASLTAPFPAEIFQTLCEMLGQSTTLIAYNAEMSEYVLRFNDNIYVDFPLIFLGDTGYKIPSHLLVEFQIVPAITGTAGLITTASKAA